MPSLSDSDRRSLLDLARQSVMEAVSRQKLPEYISREGIFAEKRGVFVTLQIKGHLRGCIGVIEADEPLGDAVVRCAASAAQHDSRFPAVRRDELESLEIEISLLSPPASIRPEQVEIGRHGLLISRSGHRGLLLPQVATEHRLSREQFLEETCLKAGLGKQAWREAGTSIAGFTCEVFSDKPHSQGA